MNRHIVAFVFIVFSLVLVGCAPPAAVENNTTVTVSVETAAEVPKTYTATQAYATFSPSVVVVETNCTYNFSYRDFELGWRQAKNARPAIFLTERGKFRTNQISITGSGTGYYRNGYIYTNDHVISCDDAENKTKDALKEAYANIVRGVYNDPTRFAHLTHLDIDAEAKTIFAAVQKENPGEYTEDQIRIWLTWEMVDYLVDHSEDITVNPVSENRVVRLEADNFETSYEATVKEHGKPWPEKDYAVLEVNGLPSSLSEITKNARVTIGEDLFIIGFPESNVDSNKTVGVLREPPVITKGIASSKRTSNGVNYYAVDAASRGGSSGSPVLNERGELLGMLTAGYNDASLSFILAVDEYE